MQFTGPEAYVSPWCEKEHFIIRTIHNGEIIWGIVVQGNQPETVIPCPTLRDARAWMDRNGFFLKTNEKIFI